MKKVKVIEIDTVHNSVIAKIWDSELKKSIDDYPAVAVDVDLIDFSEDIHPQLCQLLEGQLQYQKNLEKDIPENKLNMLSKLVDTIAEIEEDDIPLPGDEELDYQTYKSNWENGL